MTRLPIPGSDDGTWGTLLNNFLDVSHNQDGTLIPSAVALAGAEQTANKNQPNGYAGLNNSGYLPIALLPSVALTLAGSTDVVITSPSNGQALIYDGSSSKWTNQPIPSAPVTSVAGKTGAVTLAETDIANLTTDLSATEKTANKSQPGGYAALDANGNVPKSQLGNVPAAPVQSVNSQTGTVSLTAADVGADASGAAATVQTNLNTETTRAETAEATKLALAGGTMTGPIVGFEDKGSQVFNVKAYGAKGDGVTDDTAAIQAAINAASVSGGEVFSPPGIYYCLGQLNQPAGSHILYTGAGGSTSVWLYQGSTQQTFLTLPGSNQGTTFRSIGIMGALADPAINILSSAGSGSNGYQSLISFDDCQVGFGYSDATSFPSNYKSYSGCSVQSDVFRSVNTDFYGRNYGCRWQQGTTDAYCVNSQFSSLPQGGEPVGAGAWCDHLTSGLLFAGTLNLINCSVAWGILAALVIRSTANIINLYCEASPLPIYGVLSVVNLVGGSISTQATGATHLFESARVKFFETILSII